jgi:hypothetical protein
VDRNDVVDKEAKFIADICRQLSAMNLAHVHGPTLYSLLIVAQQQQ